MDRMGLEKRHKSLIPRFFIFAPSLFQHLATTATTGRTNLITGARAAAASTIITTTQRAHTCTTSTQTGNGTWSVNVELRLFGGGIRVELRISGISTPIGIRQRWPVV